MEPAALPNVWELQASVCPTIARVRPSHLRRQLPGCGVQTALRRRTIRSVIDIKQQVMPVHRPHTLDVTDRRSRLAMGAMGTRGTTVVWAIPHVSANPSGQVVGCNRVWQEVQR